MIKEYFPKEVVGVLSWMLLKISDSEKPMTKAKVSSSFSIPGLQDGYSKFIPALILNHLSKTWEASMNISKGIFSIVTDAEWYSELMDFKFVQWKLNVKISPKCEYVLQFFERL